VSRSRKPIPLIRCRKLAPACKLELESIVSKRAKGTGSEKYGGANYFLHVAVPKHSHNGAPAEPV
jgi:hypothetical protein